MTPEPPTTETAISVKLSGGDWLKLALFAGVQLVAAVIWLVNIENRVGNLEVRSGNADAAIQRLVNQGETLTRIDERTKEFDKRFERIERSVSK